MKRGGYDGLIAVLVPCCSAFSELVDQLLELGLGLAQTDVATRVAPGLGDQRTLVVSRGIEAKIAKRTPQPFGESKSIVAIPTIALEQRSNQHLHIDHVLLV